LRRERDRRADERRRRRRHRNDRARLAELRQYLQLYFGFHLDLFADGDFQFHHAAQKNRASRRALDGSAILTFEVLANAMELSFINSLFVITKLRSGSGCPKLIPAALAGSWPVNLLSLMITFEDVWAKMPFPFGRQKRVEIVVAEKVPLDLRVDEAAGRQKHPSDIVLNDVVDNPVSRGSYR
jgi:hypothetical protein